MSAPAHPPTFWRFVLCTLDGVPISMLDGIASNIEVEYRLNRPAMLSFQVPSEDPLVSILHTDGFPYLACGVRVVKAFRKVSSGEFETPGNWQIQYVGRVWQIGDSGDGDTSRSSVTCFDPLKMLEHRLVRDENGAANKQVKFYGVPGSGIIIRMIERTHTFKGPTGIEDPSSNLDNWQTTTEQTNAYDQAYILPSLISICDTGTVDLKCTYLNTESGDHLRVVSRSRLGEDKPGVIFGYAAPPRTAKQFDRTQNMDQFANDVTLWGKSVLGHRVHAENLASQALYGTFESAEVIADVETKELLQMLADEQVALRSSPQDLVTVIPAPEISAVPIDDYWLGDTVTINASKPPFPETRQIVSGVQRVYGVTLAVDDDYGENVKDLVVSAQAEGV